VGGGFRDEVLLAGEDVRVGFDFNGEGELEVLEAEAVRGRRADDERR
jgi:hypothetical protein